MTTDDLRAKLVARGYFTSEAVWIDSAGDMALMREAAAALLDQAARVEALEGALVEIASRAAQAEIYHGHKALGSASFLFAEIQRVALSTSPSVGGGDE